VINEIMYDHRAIPATPPIFSTNLMVPITNVWKYNQQGIDLGSAWRGVGYNDSTWQSGRALLFSTTSVLPAPKNTQLLITNSSGVRLITWYFRSQFVFDGSFSGLQLNLRPIIDDGAVFYLNGVEVGRLRLNANPVLFTTTASSASEPALDVLSFSTASLVDGDNVLAVEVHQQAISSSDDVFGMSLSASFREPVFRTRSSISMRKLARRFAKALRVS